MKDFRNGVYGLYKLGRLGYTERLDGLDRVIVNLVYQVEKEFAPELAVSIEGYKLLGYEVEVLRECQGRLQLLACVRNVVTAGFLLLRCDIRIAKSGVLEEILRCDIERFSYRRVDLKGRFVLEDALSFAKEKRVYQVDVSKQGRRLLGQDIVFFPRFIKQCALLALDWVENGQRLVFGRVSTGQKYLSRVSHFSWSIKDYKKKG